MFPFLISFNLNNTGSSYCRNVLAWQAEHVQFSRNPSNTDALNCGFNGMPLRFLSRIQYWKRGRIDSPWFYIIPVQMLRCLVVVLSLSSTVFAQDLFTSPLDEVRSTLLSFSSGSSTPTVTPTTSKKPASGT